MRTSGRFGAVCCTVGISELRSLRAVAQHVKAFHVRFTAVDPRVLYSVMVRAGDVADLEIDGLLKSLSAGSARALQYTLWAADNADRVRVKKTTATREQGGGTRRRGSCRVRVLLLSRRSECLCSKLRRMRLCLQHHRAYSAA
jgi:hypothetical protein